MGKRGRHVEGRGDGRTGRMAARIFIAIAFCAMLIPSVGMIWARTDATTENRALAEAPSLFGEDGTVNVDVLGEWGAYFEDHFAYRNQAVSANARLRAALLTSPSDQVVAGTEGWLYYGGTLPDYLGQQQLSGRALRNAAHNLALMQGYARSRGATFLFMVPPNKNALYDACMPYYYLRASAAGNWERLKPYLDEYGVDYLDVRELFENEDGVLYYQRDTHWTNEGALLAANAALARLAHAQLVVDDGSWVVRDDFTGDVAQMLYPADPGTEEGSYVVGVNDGEGLSGETWSYEQGTAVTDDQVKALGSGGGRLVMYRDSFGNALMPYLATAYGESTFSKLVPYNALLIDDEAADAVVVERAERHIAYLAERAPIMPNPKVGLGEALPEDDSEQASATTLSIATNGPFYVLTGRLDERLANENARICVSVEDASGEETVYEAFDTSVLSGEEFADTQADAAERGSAASAPTDYAFAAYVYASSIDLSSAKVKVFAVADGRGYGMKTFEGLESLLESQ